MPSPRNRDPLNTEQDACIGYLQAQTALLRPKIIVCLGRIAATRIIDKDFRITRQHGQWFQRAGVQMTAIYHPSALLRDPTKGRIPLWTSRESRPKCESCAPTALLQWRGNDAPLVLKTNPFVPELHQIRRDFCFA